MSSDSEVNRSLSLIRAQLNDLRAVLANLPQEGWAAETNCPI